MVEQLPIYKIKGKAGYFYLDRRLGEYRAVDFSETIPYDEVSLDDLEKPNYDKQSKGRTMKRYFKSSDLALISRRTNENFHGENYEFIAKKLGSPLQKEFKKINQQHQKIGSLPYNLMEKRHELYHKLMEELKKKSPDEYEAVYGRT